MNRMNPLRRLAASAAVLGVTALGGVALAGPALADTTAPATSATAVQTSAPSVTMSDLLAGLFSKEKAIGTVDLAKVDTLTTMSLDDLLAVVHSTDNQSPLPVGAVQVKVGGLKLTLSAPVAQKVQTVIANFYAAQGYQLAYNDKGVLVIGKRICDDTKSAAWNKGCVNPLSGARF